MNATLAADGRLRDAFQALSGTDDECSPEEVDRIWLAASGALPAEERHELVRRMAVDPALAERWRLAWELTRAAEEESRVPVWRRLCSRNPSWMPAAAALLLGVTFALVSRLGAPPDDVFRAPVGYAVESLVPREAALPRDAFQLRWTPGPPGVRYDVRVTTEDLRVLAAISDLTEPQLVLETEFLSSVEPGARILWQVDAVLPGGARVSSSTFVARAVDRK